MNRIINYKLMSQMGSSNAHPNDNLLVKEIGTKLGKQYVVETSNSNYSCVVYKLGKRDVVGLTFEKNGFAISYLKKSNVEDVDFLEVHNIKLPSIVRVCSFIRTIHN